VDNKYHAFKAFINRIRWKNEEEQVEAQVESNDENNNVLVLTSLCILWKTIPKYKLDKYAFSYKANLL